MVTYNRRKFLKYIKADMLLTMLWEEYRTLPEAELMLQAMFNTHVTGNSIAEKLYEATK